MSYKQLQGKGGHAMYLKQSDILKGLNHRFVKEFMNLTSKESHSEGKTLFERGHKADNFYILLKGRIKLIIGESGPIVYTVSHPGEAFGWSSLIGREVYSASAQCAIESKTLRIERVALLKIMELEPAEGMAFFRNLAATLGNRLLTSYKMMSNRSSVEDSASFGSRQVHEFSTQS
jgi:CRP/FNR family transcriptional regulator, cyclic AMP receptor protein